MQNPNPLSYTSPMNICIFGEAQSGRATLGGYLLSLHNKIPLQKGVQLVRRIRDSHEIHKSMPYLHFQINKRPFLITDYSGHKKFVRNLILESYDCAVVVVSRQTKELKDQLELIKWVGVRSIVVCINKMDGQGYGREGFEQKRAEIGGILREIGVREADVLVIPTSALHGHNVVERSEKMQWYCGPTLSEYLYNIPTRNCDLILKPLRIPIQDTFKIGGIGIVVCGRVESGYLLKNSQVLVEPSGLRIKITQLQMHHNALDQAFPGDNIGIAVKGVTNKSELKTGHIIGDTWNPPKKVTEFVALVYTGTQITKDRKIFERLHLGTSSVTVEIKDILCRIDRRSGRKIKQRQILREGDCGLIVLKPTQDFSCEVYAEIANLGRFVIRTSKKIFGIVVSIHDNRKG